MLGRHHVLFGLTAGVVLDSEVHLTGHPLLSSLGSPGVAILLVLANKIVFYGALAFGALLPDIDQAHSIVGRCCGLLSKGIQHYVGHRHFFHSLLGLVPWAVLSIALYQVAVHLLGQAGLAVPGVVVGVCQVAFAGLLFGCATHLVADGLTEEGVPLFWPYPVHFGFPPDPRWRIRTGHLGERLIVYGFIALVILGCVESVLTV